MEGKKRQRKK